MEYLQRQETPWCPAAPITHWAAFQIQAGTSQESFIYLFLAKEIQIHIYVGGKYCKLL